MNNGITCNISVRISNFNSNLCNSNSNRCNSNSSTTPPIFHRRQPHPDDDLLYDASVYQVYFSPKTVTYVFRPTPPHPDADLLYDESVYCAYFPLYRCEGVTGTGGAVKPRSSVDVFENRSSKSMDDEQARSGCELSLANIPSTKGHIVTGQSDKKDKRTELAENNDKKKLGVSEHRVFGTMYRDSNSVTQERHMQLHLKALIHSFNNVWYGLYWTKHSLMLYTFPEAATSDTDTDYHETFAHELVTSVVLLQGLLDGLMILSEGAAPDVNFHSRNFCDHKMRDIRKQMMMLKSVGDETRPELYADFWGITNFWKHYFPYTLLPTCRGSRSIHDVYVKLGDNTCIRFSLLLGPIFFRDRKLSSK